MEKGLLLLGLFTSLSLALVGSCGMAPDNYGVKGVIYDVYNSNVVQGIEIRLYDQNLSSGSLSASNGYFENNFEYTYYAGCTPHSSFPEADRNQDFFIEVNDIDGTNNGKYQSIVTNIGSIYSDPHKTIDFYLQTN